MSKPELPSVQSAPVVAAAAGAPASRPTRIGVLGPVRAGSGMLLLALLGATVVSLGHVAVQARRVEAAVSLGREQADHRVLIDKRRHLLLDLERLKDPARLVRISRDELGMAQPSPTAIRSLGRPR